MCNCLGCEPKSIPLSPDEIRTAWGYRDKFLEARARATLATEMEAEYFNQLRAKYDLDETWVCNDLLNGFERVKEGSQHDENN